MALTPDGNTIFIAGIYGAAVQPTPSSKLASS
jgi:hypothetical protein